MSRTRSPICKPWCDASSAVTAADSATSFFFAPSAETPGANKCANAFSVACNRSVTAEVVAPEPSIAHALVRTSTSDKRSRTPSLKHRCATRGVLGENNHSTSRDAVSIAGVDADVAAVEASPPDSSPRPDPPAGSSVVTTPLPSVFASSAGKPRPTSASTAPSRSPHAAYTDARQRRHSWCSAAAELSRSRDTSVGANASPGCSLLT
mmetsp:Transcript_11353/g.47478  ORF Transcript_11353/g.47478 Transcript_11353/m.47478 type:complete len:208 (-) Transcript_11353:1420-2043(-)